MPSIKGTASVSDSRALTKALTKTKFPISFRESLDIGKINRTVLADWIASKITSSLGFEDEIVQNTAVNLFLPEIDADAPPTARCVDPKTAQIDLAGFLGDKPAATLCKEIWDALLDAAKEPTGIPRFLLEQKKKELAQPPPAQDIRRPNRNDNAPRDPYHGRESNYRHGPGDGPMHPPREDRRRIRSVSPYDRRPQRPVDPPPRRGPHDYERGDERHYREPYGARGRGPPYGSSDYRPRYDDRRSSRDDPYRRDPRYRHENDVYDEYGRRRHTTRRTSRSSSSSSRSSSSTASSDRDRSRNHDRHHERRRHRSHRREHGTSRS